MRTSVLWTRVYLLPLELMLCFLVFALPALSQNAPAVPKDSVRVLAVSSFKTLSGKNIHGWMPAIRFRVIGPIASGSVLWVDFSVPSTPVKFDCPRIERQDRWDATCGGVTAAGNKLVFFAGTVGFSIHLRNELQEIDTTLFTGKMKVGKVLKDNGDPVFYVDEDWRLPIGYVFLQQQGSEDSVTGMAFNLKSTLWFRGRPSDVEAHLLYQGKDVATGETCEPGKQIEESNHSEVGPDWMAFECEFPVWDVKPRWDANVRHVLSGSPGEYEVKLLVNGQLSRSMKFSVANDGRLEDNGIADSTTGRDRMIAPVRVLGNADGNWNKLAWKTEAFYGNPLTGFTAPP